MTDIKVVCNVANDGIENLIPVRSKEEAREKGRKGGIASGIARREKKEQKKTIAQALELILNAKIPDAMTKKMQAQTGISELDYRTALAYSVISTGNKKGDANALRVIADYIGEKPADNLNINADENSKFADILNQWGNGCSNVIDLYGGSGSTLIACEQLSRNCFMMELDPHYVDVIIARWEQFTGKKAVLING